MRAYPLVVISLSLLVVAIVALGYSDTSPECLTCHSGPAPKGSYRMELPRLVLEAPEVVNGSSSFQLLVLLEHEGEYEVVAPRLTMTYTEGGGPPIVVLVEMVALETEYSAVVRVNATKGPVIVSVGVDMLLHYDHPDPGEADLAPYSATSSIRVELHSDEGGQDGDLPEPERSPGPSLVPLIAIATFIALVLPGRRTGRS